MSMYVELLSTALDAWVEPLSDEEILRYALDRRAEMLRASNLPEADVYDVIATEVTYDCALLKLCERSHVDATVTAFCFPRAERARVERALARHGTDLAALARRRG